MKILLIEDDELMTRLYERIFTREGIEVVSVSRGTEGLKKAGADIDLILLDVMMPEMDGYEVLTQLKQNEHTKKIPVITLTNLAGDAERDKALQLGATKHLVKSEHDPKEILDIVKVVLDSAGS